MKTDIYDILIIGGGAAGLFAGAVAPRRLNGLIIDKSKKPGLKLLMSGAGQCNLTRGGSIKDFVTHYGEHGGRVRKSLYGFNNLAVVEFFEKRGLRLTEREDGKIFPASFKSEDVLEVLLQECERNGFSRIQNCCAESIAVGDDGIFSVGTDKGVYHTRKLLVCTGGCSYPTTGSDGKFFSVLEGLGLRIVTPRPALVPISVEHFPYSDLSGVSIKNVEVSAEGHTVVGDVLFTHKNFSGPGILHISRYVKPGSVVSLNYCAGAKRQLIEEELERRRRASGKVADGKGTIGKDADGRNANCKIAAGKGTIGKNADGKLAGAKGSRKEALTVLSEVLQGLPSAFLKKIWQEEGLDAHLKMDQWSARAARGILDRLFADQFSVSGTAGFRVAMATAGGVDLSEISTSTFETKSIPGLYIAGEALDVDGDTGGYNLQFAFSSARAAIYSAINSL